MKPEPERIEQLIAALDLNNLITEMDDDGCLLTANDQFYQLSGYAEGELKDLTRLRSGNLPATLYDEIWTTIRSGKVWNGELENRSKGGNIFWTDTTIIPQSEDPKRYLTVSSNISERKFAEKEIKKLNEKLQKEIEKRSNDIQEAVNELEAFSYSVSHDLRAPLRAITGFSGLLEEEFGNEMSDEALRYLGIIKDGTHQMAQLIDDLLQFSRVGRIELLKEDFDPNILVHEILKKERIAIDDVTEVSVNPMPAIHGDAKTIKLVFSNLILNALKFSEEQARPRIVIGSKNVDGEDIYYVQDNGVGFDMRYADKLFKVFQRLHSAQEFEGTGVGLAIVSRIVHKHGGRVWGESYPGSDTSFFFTIPKSGENE